MSYKWREKLTKSVENGGGGGRGAQATRGKDVLGFQAETTTSITVAFCPIVVGFLQCFSITLYTYYIKYIYFPSFIYCNIQY